MAVQKLPLNLKESWALLTVKKHCVKPTLLDFNDWLKEKAEAHDLMKKPSLKARTEDNKNSVVKTKVASRTLAANTQYKGTQGSASTSATSPTSRFIVCKGNHCIWECREFKENSPTQRAKAVAEAKLCFSLEKCIYSGNAQVLGNAGRTDVTAPTIHFSMELRGFIHQNPLQPTMVILMLAQIKVNFLESNHRVRPLLCHL